MGWGGRHSQTGTWRGTPVSGHSSHVQTRLVARVGWGGVGLSSGTVSSSSVNQSRRPQSQSRSDGNTELSPGDLKATRKGSGCPQLPRSFSEPVEGDLTCTGRRPQRRPCLPPCPGDREKAGKKPAPSFQRETEVSLRCFSRDVAPVTFCGHHLSLPLGTRSHRAAGGWWATAGRRAVGGRQSAVLSPFMEEEEEKQLMGRQCCRACADGTAGPRSCSVRGQAAAGEASGRPAAPCTQERSPKRCGSASSVPGEATSGPLLWLQ